MVEQNEGLSEREIEILRLVATGAANKEIATALSISPNTVKVHLRNIFTKIGVVSRTEATLYAIKQGFVSSPLPDTPPDPFDQPLPDSPMALSVPIVEDAHPAPAAMRKYARRWAWLLAGLTGILLIAFLVYSGTRQAQPTSLSTPSLVASPTPIARWEADTPLPEERMGMGAAVYGNHCYLIAGETSSGITNHTSEFDPNTHTWKMVASKPTPVTRVQAAVLGEKIYVPGGMLSTGKPTDSMEVYDPRQDTWSSAAKLPVALSSYALAAFEGNLYLFGGWNGKTAVSSIYQYNPDQDQWKKRQDLPAALMEGVAVSIDGKILVIGGSDGQTASQKVVAYIPARDSSAGGTPWESAPDLPEARSDMAGIALANNVYLIGGKVPTGNATQPPALVLIQGSETWQSVELPANSIGADPAAVMLGNYIHIFGGSSQQSISSLHVKYQALYTIAIPLISSSNKTP